MNTITTNLQSIALKEQYVWNSFTAYRYHCAKVRVLQEELNEIAKSLSFQQGKLTPFTYEAFEQEHILMQEMYIHIHSIKQVDTWLEQITNANHKEIIVAYLMEHRCKDVTLVAQQTFNSEANVSKVSKNIIKKIASSL